LPIISDYLSPNHISCMEGGVSSAVAAFRGTDVLRRTDLTYLHLLE
jgi:hypothetical protein